MENLMNKSLEDVIIQILLRLPVKSLLRFRCICKAWCNLIKSLDFIAMHFNHPTAENDYHVLIKRCPDRVTNILSVHSNTESLTITSPDLKIPHLNHDFVHVLGPCNGLVCITDYNIIILCNPATKEFTLLPSRPFGCPQDMHCVYYGAGFGFDANTNDYKVIRIVDITDEDDYNVHVFKAELYRHSADYWREIDYALQRIWRADCFEIFFHGATHWFAQRERREKVLSFNITTELFQEFDFPEGCSPLDDKRKSLTVLNQSLAMLSYTYPWPGTDQKFIDVWVMREYGIPESWTKQFAIGPLLDILHPLTSWKNSALLIESTNGKLISCTLDTQEVKEFDIFSYPTTLRALVYKESLVSVRK